MACCQGEVDGMTTKTTWSDKTKQNGVKLTVKWWRDRLVKTIDGHKYYFKHPNSEAGYEATCLDLARLKRIVPITKAIESRLALAAVAPANAKSRFEAEANALKTLKSGQSIDEVVIRLDPLLGLSHEAKAIWRDRQQRTTVETGQTVGRMIQQFLRLKRSQVAAGAPELTTWGDLNNELKLFSNWIGKESLVKNINGTTPQSLLLESGGSASRRSDPERPIQHCSSVAALAGSARGF